MGQHCAWELHIEGYDVPPALRERALAAAKRVCPEADGDLWHEAFETCDFCEYELDLPAEQWTPRDVYLTELWDQARTAAKLVLGEGHAHLAVRRALDHAGATARASWIDTATSALVRQGLDYRRAYMAASVEWVLATRDEEDISAGLAIDPETIIAGHQR